MLCIVTQTESSRASQYSSLTHTWVPDISQPNSRSWHSTARISPSLDAIVPTVWYHVYLMGMSQISNMKRYRTTIYCTSPLDCHLTAKPLGDHLSYSWHFNGVFSNQTKPETPLMNSDSPSFKYFRGGSSSFLTSCEPCLWCRIFEEVYSRQQRFSRIHIPKKT